MTHAASPVPCAEREGPLRGSEGTLGVAGWAPNTLSPRSAATWTLGKCTRARVQLGGTATQAQAAQPRRFSGASSAKCATQAPEWGGVPAPTPQAASRELPACSAAVLTHSAALTACRGSGCSVLAVTESRRGSGFASAAGRHARSCGGRAGVGPSAPSRRQWGQSGRRGVWCSRRPHSPGTGAQRLRPCHMTGRPPGLSPGSLGPGQPGAAPGGSSVEPVPPPPLGLGLHPSFWLLCGHLAAVVREACGALPARGCERPAPVPCSNAQEGGLVSGTASSGLEDTGRAGDAANTVWAARGQACSPGNSFLMGEPPG